MSDIICGFCGTINNAHHSAACEDAKSKRVNDFHSSHKEAIAKKWVYSPKEAVAECNRLATALQNIMKIVAESEKIPWGYDGDCGSAMLFDEINDECIAALSAAERLRL